MLLYLLPPILKPPQFSFFCQCGTSECCWKWRDMYFTNRDKYVNWNYKIKCIMAQIHWEVVICTSHWYFNADITNQMISLILNTTNNPGSQSVACSQVSEEAGRFECDFCYSAGDSCQNLTTCISATVTPTLLPSLTELTYCYRATASINGVAVAVIQDTFNTGMHGYN